MKRYVYYQPNDKDLKDEFGDCQVRALTKALGLTWIEAYDLMYKVCRKYQVMMPFDCPPKIREQLLAEMGFKSWKISVKKGKKRPTVDSFAKDHPSGTYVLNVAGHDVACVNGKYYDTWDCGYKSVYSYYEVIKED